jgi:hypothetical protein
MSDGFRLVFVTGLDMFVRVMFDLLVLRVLFVFVWVNFGVFVWVNLFVLNWFPAVVPLVVLRRNCWLPVVPERLTNLFVPVGFVVVGS